MDLFGRKEEKTQNLIEQHVALVGETLRRFGEIFRAFLAGEDSYREGIHEVGELEHQADETRRDVERHLYEGAFMPIFREDYIVLAELVDDVANRAQTCTDLIGQQRPHVPEEVVEELHQLTGEVLRTFEPLPDMILEMEEGNRDRVQALIQRVREGEERVDELEWDVIRRIWELDALDLAEKMQVRDLILLVASIADRIEDVSDRVNIMMVKQTL